MNIWHGCGVIKIVLERLNRRTHTPLFSRSSTGLSSGTNKPTGINPAGFISCYFYGSCPWTGQVLLVTAQSVNRLGMPFSTARKGGLSKGDEMIGNLIIGGALFPHGVDDIHDLLSGHQFPGFPG